MNDRFQTRWRKNLLIFVAALLFSTTDFVSAANWPQWRGPNRDGKSTETGLLKKWPETGPTLLWSSEVIGNGFSSPSISGGMLYITGIDDEKMEFLTAMDLQGNVKWKITYGLSWTNSFSEARTTPTIDGKFVYVISGQGKVVCVDRQTGQEKWSVEALKNFGGKTGRWGVAESPLIVDDKVIFTPGGDQTTVVALNKLTGETVWQTKSLNYQTAYVSPILISYKGKKQIVAITGQHILGVNPKNGEIDWTYDYLQHFSAGRGGEINTNSPLFYNSEIYVTSGYNHVGIKLKLADDLKSVAKVWIDETLDVHHGGFVLVDGFLYGANWLTNSKGNWAAVDWKTGKPAYDTEWENKGSIIYADGMLYCYDEKGGNVALVTATPKAFNIVSTFKVPLGGGIAAWAHPVICDGRLYMRRGNALMVYDIKQ